MQDLSRSSNRVIHLHDAAVDAINQARQNPRSIRLDLASFVSRTPQTCIESLLMSFRSPPAQRLEDSSKMGTIATGRRGSPARRLVHLETWFCVWS